ncbi:maleylpyruvate isomerase N-terminal domain-containing protein [Streptomyces ziwulingensis]|uniref:maleylpyruvate isomerase N-terminal domain-containing protein n=1 Tax=Streptomyces ziwulingensis TaxID=1045501 RepID=UPI003CD0670D
MYPHHIDAGDAGEAGDGGDQDTWPAAARGGPAGGPVPPDDSPNHPGTPHGSDGPDGPDRPDDPLGSHGPHASHGPHEPGGPDGSGGSDGPGGSDGSGGSDGPGGSDGSGGSDGPGGPGGAGSRGGRGAGREPRIPLPRTPVEDGGLPQSAPSPAPPPAPPAPARGAAVQHVPLVLEHQVLTSLLGAWALAVCSPEEAAAVDAHLGACATCAEEAGRLRRAVALLQRPESLDLDLALRNRVLDGCLARRPPRIPVPEWATPYDAETARLDALLQDIGDADWHTPVRLRWFSADGTASRRATVAGVVAHLLAVDGLVAVALGLPDPLGEIPAPNPAPASRTEAYWRASHLPPTRAVRAPWRAQSHDLVRTVSFTGSGAGRMPVSYGDFELPLHDAMVDRAFECWVHAEDIAQAVAYPYGPPSPRHLNRMIDLAARMLPAALAQRRRAGTAAPGGHRHLVAAGAPGRSLRLEIEGSGGGEWLIPLDSPAAGSAAHEVAHVALDGVEFCRLTAGRVPPEEAAAGQDGDREAIRDVLFAAASLSRM